VTLDFSRPGKPTDNPFIESLNGSFRDECLNVNWFLSLEGNSPVSIECLWYQVYKSARHHFVFERTEINRIVKAGNAG